MPETVVAVFEKHQDAVRGVEQLRRAGFAADQISILAPDPREAEGYAEELGVRVVQAGAAGVAAGGLLGGLSGWLVALTGLAVPGAGLILAAGPLATAIVGAVSGASVGGFLGVLVGLGLPRQAAQEYNRELQSGRTLVFVHAGDRFGLAEAALNHARPIGLHHHTQRVGVEEDGRPLARPSHEPFANPTEHVEPAAPDRSLNPEDVSTSIEGQEVMGHTEWLDEADLRPVSGKKDV